MTDLSDLPIANLDLATVTSDDRISQFFTIRELIRSDLASRNAIDNRFQEAAHLRAAAHLARHVLDRVRSQHGPFAPNSVYRTQAVERVLKTWAAEKLPEFDQLICECFDPQEGANSGWVHISLRPPGAAPNRRQLLSYVKAPATGKYVYVEGLRASA